NHLHILLALPPAIPLAKVVQDLKGNSSKWLGELGEKFAWQRGYGAFSVSESKREQLIAYITGQEEHHRRWTFEQEYRSLSCWTSCGASRTELHLQSKRDEFSLRSSTLFMRTLSRLIVCAFILPALAIAQSAVSPEGQSTSEKTKKATLTAQQALAVHASA